MRSIRVMVNLVAKRLSAQRVEFDDTEQNPGSGNGRANHGPRPFLVGAAPRARLPLENNVISSCPKFCGSTHSTKRSWANSEFTGACLLQKVSAAQGQFPGGYQGHLSGATKGQTSVHPRERFRPTVFRSRDAAGRSHGVAEIDGLVQVDVSARAATLNSGARATGSVSSRANPPTSRKLSCALERATR